VAEEAVGVVEVVLSPLNCQLNYGRKSTAVVAILVTEADLVTTRRTGISGLKAIKPGKNRVEDEIRRQEPRDHDKGKKNLKLVLLDYLTNLPPALKSWPLHRLGARRRKSQL